MVFMLQKFFLQSYLGQFLKFVLFNFVSPSTQLPLSSLQRLNFWI